MENEQETNNTEASIPIPSSEEQARRFNSAMLKQSTIDQILTSQETQGCIQSQRHTQQSLSDKCFSAAFLTMQQSSQMNCSEPIFTLRQLNGSFFGYFSESALHLCM